MPIETKLVVESVSWEFQRNRALCDKSVKFETLIVKGSPKKNGYRAIANMTAMAGIFKNGYH